MMAMMRDYTGGYVTVTGDGTTEVNINSDGSFTEIKTGFPTDSEITVKYQYDSSLRSDTWGGLISWDGKVIKQSTAPYTKKRITKSRNKALKKIQKQSRKVNRK